MTEQVRFNGTTILEDPIPGERLTLLVVATVTAHTERYADTGEITDTYTLTVEETCRPSEDMLTQVTERLQAVQDRRSGRQPLPMGDR